MQRRFTDSDARLRKSASVLKGKPASPLVTVVWHPRQDGLAIKCVLADLGPAGMYVLDEVDSGIGGGMAERAVGPNASRCLGQV